jgi:hypothetical protein
MREKPTNTPIIHSVYKLRKVAQNPLVNLSNDIDKPSDFLMAGNFLIAG